MTSTQHAILKLLAENDEMTGLAMVKAGVGMRGTIYVYLVRLVNAGLVCSRVVSYPTHAYSITDEGRGALALSSLSPGEVREGFIDWFFGPKAKRAER